MISYSGLVNYGKATLPTVESWNMSSSIVKDPPKSIHTRKIDKVGQTSYLNTVIDESTDRVCESINHYARGVNPMVSVNYGQGQNVFLPHRVAKDGAFRPPILRLEDLLPKSRLPRIWTSMNTQPFNIKYTERPFNGSTVESTKEVKTNVVHYSCQTQKSSHLEPDTTPPLVQSHIIYDPLVPGEHNTALQNYSNNSWFEKVQEQKPIVLAPRINAVGYTNPFKIVERPQIANNIHLVSNHPAASASTNPSSCHTLGNSMQNYEASFNRLPPRLDYGSFTNSVNIPYVEMNHVLPKLRSKITSHG